MTTLNEIFAKRDFLLNSSQSSQKIQNMKKGKYEVMAEKLLIWFKQDRSASIPISWPILREKAQEIDKKNGLIEWKKKRVGLSYNSVKGERKTVYT